MDVPQVERAVAVLLCLQNAATGCNQPRLPSKVYKITPSLTVKAYSTAGQVTSALHAMSILQVHQAEALKMLQKGCAESIIVVQQLHLWLNFS